MSVPFLFAAFFLPIRNKFHYAEEKEIADFNVRKLIFYDRTLIIYIRKFFFYVLCNFASSSFNDISIDDDDGAWEIILHIWIFENKETWRLLTQRIYQENSWAD